MTLAGSLLFKEILDNSVLEPATLYIDIEPFVDCYDIHALVTVDIT